MMKFFGGWKGTQLEFRKKLAYELIHNALDVDGAITRSLVNVRPTDNAHHAYISIPPFSKWIDGKWKKVFARGYQQMTCSGDSCTKRIRKVCICDPTSVLCSRCYTNHLVTASNDAIAESWSQLHFFHVFCSLFVFIDTSKLIIESIFLLIERVVSVLLIHVYCIVNLKKMFYSRYIYSQNKLNSAFWVYNQPRL